MGGDIEEIKLGSEREIYKYINHYVAVNREKCFSTSWPRAGFLTSAYVRIQSINQSNHS